MKQRSEKDLRTWRELYTEGEHRLKIRSPKASRLMAKGRELCSMKLSATRRYSEALCYLCQNWSNRQDHKCFHLGRDSIRNDHQNAEDQQARRCENQHNFCPRGSCIVG